MSLDYIWQIYLSSVGKTYCFKDYMSAYRYNADGSWSMRTRNDKMMLISHIEKVLIVLEMINKETHYKYDSIIKETILNYKFKILKIERKYKLMHQEPYIEIWKKLSLEKKLKYFFDEHFPEFYGIIKKLLKK